MSTATELPESFPAGTTVKYTRSLADYPANDGWTLTLALAGPGVLTVAAAANGADHDIVISAEQTAALPAGEYYWAESAAKDGEVYRAASGRVMVEPYLEAAGAGDLQASDEKLYAAVDALINARLGKPGCAVPKDIEAYSVDGITVTKIPLEQLEKLRTKLAFQIARRRRGGGFGRQHRVTFTGE